MRGWPTCPARYGTLTPTRSRRRPPRRYPKRWRRDSRTAMAAAAAGSRPADYWMRWRPARCWPGFAGDAWTGGLRQLSDDELIGVVCAWRRQASWSAAGEAAAVGELAGRRAAQSRAGRNRHLAEHVDSELAAALTLTGRSAGRLLELAAGLARLPGTATALAGGRIDWPRAIVIIDELAALSDTEAAAVEARVLGDAPGRTTGQLRAVVRRQVLATDPGAAIRRREKAQKEARVETWTEPSGTGSLAGRDLPPAEVITADKRLDADARWLKGHGADGTLSQLRARAFSARLNGLPLETLLPRPAPARLLTARALTARALNATGTGDWAPTRRALAASAALAMRALSDPGTGDPGNGPGNGGPGGRPGGAGQPCPPGPGRISEPDHATGQLAGLLQRTRRGRRARPAGRSHLPRPSRRAGHRPAIRLVPHHHRPGWPGDRARLRPRRTRAARHQPCRLAARDQHQMARGRRLHPPAPNPGLPGIPLTPPPDQHPPAQLQLPRMPAPGHPHRP